MKPPGLSQESFAELQQLIVQAGNSAREDNMDNTLPMTPSDSDSDQVATTSFSDNATTSTMCAVTMTTKLQMEPVTQSL